MAPAPRAPRRSSLATPIGVLNAGISGNRIVNDGAQPFIGPSALARFERDAEQTGRAHDLAV